MWFIGIRKNSKYQTLIKCFIKGNNFGDHYRGYVTNGQRPPTSVK